MAGLAEQHAVVTHGHSRGRPRAAADATARDQGDSEACHTCKNSSGPGQRGVPGHPLRAKDGFLHLAPSAMKREAPLLASFCRRWRQHSPHPGMCSGRFPGDTGLTTWRAPGAGKGPAAGRLVLPTSVMGKLVGLVGKPSRRIRAQAPGVCSKVMPSAGESARLLWAECFCPSQIHTLKP